MVVYSKQDRRWNAEKPSATLDHKMIIHFANQSQTCQLLSILKTFYFQTFNEKKLWRAWYVCVCMWSNWHNILTISPSVHRNVPGGR